VQNVGVCDALGPQLHAQGQFGMRKQTTERIVRDQRNSTMILRSTLALLVLLLRRTLTKQPPQPARQAR